MHLWHWDLSIPLVYLEKNGDETWQLILTKALIDTGWVLNNPYLGAPDVAHWHNNAAAQASALHSVLMLGLSKLLHNSIETQQVYFLLNFSLISLTSFLSCKLLGLSRIPSFCIGILFSLIGYRYNFIIYSFLVNYFTVPLALVSVFWIMTGKFSKPFFIQGSLNKIVLKEVLSSAYFFLGLFFIVLIAISDGYYAFFTLLLLAFATVVRALSGDIKKPVSLIVPTIYIATLITVAMVLTMPLGNYKNIHPEEFAPNGIKDPSLIKHPFEAEIYSVSLKLLLTPPPNHQIESLASLGKKIVQTSEDARKFKIGAPNVVLGILGSILFAIALCLLTVPSLRGVFNIKNLSQDLGPEESLLWASVTISLFIFLCSISGGIGTIVALVYPTIRAYDRFPLFLIFVLYVGAGAALTISLKQAHAKRWWFLVCLTVLITISSIFDQMPNDAAKASFEVRNRFLAEDKFVKSIEAKLLPGAMVYQYPYSQYLTNSDYYGWGGWGHVRLYLHSAELRWSNGASKNSPVDIWHLHLSQMPIGALITEVQSVGFNAVVVDRRVVSIAEYQLVRAELLKHSSDAPIEDEESKLSFFKLSNPGYRLVYEDSYKEPEKLVISDRYNLEKLKLPQLINPVALNALLINKKGKGTVVVERRMHPEVFFTSTNLYRGAGENLITPLSDMKGDVRCKKQSKVSSEASDDTILMNISNNSDFDWKLNQGNFPIKIGVHLRNIDGTIIQWDSGWRFSDESHGFVSPELSRNDAMYIPRGAKKQFLISIPQLNLKKFGAGHQNLIVDFRMVQDGHAWFENLGCKVEVKL